MRLFVVLGLLTALAACQKEVEPPNTGLAGYDPNLINNQRAICEEKGGRFGAGGFTGSFACYLETKDANKRCTASSDCEGLCLARSGTCSPVTPFFGCHEVLGRLGAPSTLCIE